MAKYVTIRVKIVREFDDEQRIQWGGRYLGMLGDVDAPQYVVFDDVDVAEGDASHMFMPFEIKLNGGTLHE
jgi:hypothetical protein